MGRVGSWRGHGPTVPRPRKGRSRGYAGIVAPDGEGEVGGLDEDREPGRTGPLVLLFSDDLNATASAVTRAGGQVVAGPYEFPGGRRFHFTDPAGNELGVWATR
ncbi:hypothetical protein GCM10009718_00930 [Isoptericola halotolerans]